MSDDIAYATIRALEYALSQAGAVARRGDAHVAGTHRAARPHAARLCHPDG